MELFFALLKFWKSNSAKVAAGTTTGYSAGAGTVADSTVSDLLKENIDDDDDDDDDDSFFELELTLPNYDSKLSKPQEREIEPKPSSKPRSPISILRSSPPKLRFFMFGKRKNAMRNEFETESVFPSNFSTERNDSSLFTVKFEIEDGSIVPKLTRSNSYSLSSAKSSDDGYDLSKRFSKDVIQKYLNLIKPLYTKSSKRYGETEKFAASPARSTVSFPSPRKEKEKHGGKFKVKCKQLGKSKSASALIGAPSPAIFPVRSDHPLDCIEGAILHCKRSLNSSKGHSSLSRCSSDPSHEKSILVSEEI